MLERVIGSEASDLRRLGALSALLCGACALIGVVLAIAQPCASNLAATALAALIALAGALVARRS